MAMSGGSSLPHSDIEVSRSCAVVQAESGAGRRPNKLWTWLVLAVILALVSGCGGEEASSGVLPSPEIAPDPTATASLTNTQAVPTSTPVSTQVSTATPTLLDVPIPTITALSEPSVVVSATPDDAMIGALILILPSEAEVGAVFGVPAQAMIEDPGDLGPAFDGVTNIVSALSGIYTTPGEDLFVNVGLALFGSDDEAAEWPFLSSSIESPGMTRFPVEGIGDAAGGYTFDPDERVNPDMYMTWLPVRSDRLIISIFVIRYDDHDVREPLRLLAEGIVRWAESVGPNAPEVDLDLIPVALAPAGLGTLTIPDDATMLATIFNQLPAQAVGHDRLPPDEHVQQYVDRWHPRCAMDCEFTATYGEASEGNHPEVTAYIDAVNIIGITNFYPRNWGAGHILAEAFIEQEGWQPQVTPEENFDEGTWRDGSLVWALSIQEVYVDPGEPPDLNTAHLYQLQWGSIESPWLFTITAESPEQIDEILTAFVGTTSRSASTP